MVRTPELGTHDGKYQTPLHHPACEDYKTERFVRIGFDGQWLIVEPDDEVEYKELAELEGTLADHTFDDVYLTRDQFEALPEFDGF